MTTSKRQIITQNWATWKILWKHRASEFIDPIFFAFSFHFIFATTVLDVDALWMRSVCSGTISL